jgi:hypothetical protein
MLVLNVHVAINLDMTFGGLPLHNPILLGQCFALQIFLYKIKCRHLSAIYFPPHLVRVLHPIDGEKVAKTIARHHVSLAIASPTGLMVIGRCHGINLRNKDKRQ